MKTRTLGQGLEVSALGLGCMGMTGAYGTPNEVESRATIAKAVDLGITFFDTADMYGWGANERLVGHALAHHRDRIVLATKFGFTSLPPGGHAEVSGTPEHVREACDASLQRLGVDHIDLY